MNTLSSIFKWIGNTIGANPNTLTTTDKTIVGAINEVKSEADTTVSNVYTKSEVYSKGDFVTITGSVDIGSSWGTGSASYDASTLKTNYGIDDLNDYEVISIRQFSNQNQRAWGTYNVLNNSTTPISYAFPRAEKNHLGGLIVYVSHTSSAASATLYFAVVLLKVR